MSRVLSGLRGEQAVSLFVDELRCPIMVEDAARQIWEIARLPREQRSGTWHLGAPEAMSRYALGLLIASVYRLDGRGLIPASSGAGSEPRPRDLRLKTDRADARLMTRPRPVSAATLRGASGPSE